MVKKTYSKKIRAFLSFAIGSGLWIMKFLSSRFVPVQNLIYTATPSRANALDLNSHS
jgi:hypothetical protein